jgi:hypothetical protein
MKQSAGGVMKIRLLITGFLAWYLACGGVIQAQERASIQALATVVSSLSVLGTNNLQFGTVTLGVSKTVDKTDIGFAGEWTITGTVSAELSVDFSLPAVLRTTDTLSAMPINFRAIDASYGNSAANQTSPTGVLNPNGPAVQRIGASGQMLIWIGGVVYPSIFQTGGDYSGEIMLTVAYTGN